MRILVTGANGYLGQGITKKLLDDGHEVTASDCSSEFIDHRAEKAVCNLFELENPYEYFGRPQILLHLAWRNGFLHYSNSHVDELPMHYKFIQKMAEAGVHKISVMGSMHEIGFFEGSIKEDTPCNPVTPYGISKNALRKLTEMICIQHHVIYQWLRGYYIVGNSKSGSSIFSKIAAAESSGETEFSFTMGLNQFDFIDYEEFCSQTAAAVGQNKIKSMILEDKICWVKTSRTFMVLDAFFMQPFWLPINFILQSCYQRVYYYYRRKKR